MTDVSNDLRPWRGLQEAPPMTGCGPLRCEGVGPTRHLHGTSNLRFNMIRFYSGSGAQDIELLDEKYSEDHWQKVKSAAVKILVSKGALEAGTFLSSQNFQLREATNNFGDEFCVLYKHVPIREYERDLELVDDFKIKDAARMVAQQIAQITNEHIRFVASDLQLEENVFIVSQPSLTMTTNTLERALGDAERLIATQGPTSAVDRIHTAFQAYLKTLAKKSEIPFADNADVTSLFKLIRTRHPAFSADIPNLDAVEKIFKSLANIVDALNPLRNHSSVAHANERLLPKAEAMLAINSVRTLMHYINDKTRGG